jgi:hypothetical protein
LADEVAGTVAVRNARGTESFDVLATWRLAGATGKLADQSLIAFGVLGARAPQQHRTGDALAVLDDLACIRLRLAAQTIGAIVVVEAVLA